MKKLFQFLAQLIRIILTVIGLLLLVGQFNYWLGLSLNFSRWWIIGVGGLLTLWGWKTTYQKTKVTLLIVIMLLIGDGAWKALQYQSLESISPIKAPQNKEITIMSYNVFFKNTYLSQATKLIEQHHPDILLIQELTPTWHQRLLKKFGKLYPYRALKPLKGTHGIGIYSKYPLKNIRYLNNSSKRPIAQAAIVQVNGKNLQLTNIHLASPSRAVEHPEHFFTYMESNAKLREKQWEQLESFIRQKKNKVNLVIGDANTLPYEPLYQEMRTSYVDLHSKVGNGLGATFPNTAKIPFPFLRLDYAFASGPIQPINMEVIKGGSSDHLPILLKVAF